MKRIFHVISGLFLMANFQGCTLLVQPKQTDDASQSRPPITYSDPVLNQRRIMLFGDINEVMAKDTIQKLFFLDAQKDEPIDMYLMTPGGNLKSAFAIENAMQLIRSRVNTYAFSECNSAGAVLLAAGTGKRVAFQGALIVIHGMQVHGKGPKEYIDGTQAYYTAFWRRRTRLPSQWLPITQNKLRVLTAEQALEYGVVDKIVERQMPQPNASTQTRQFLTVVLAKRP